MTDSAKLKKQRLKLPPLTLNTCEECRDFVRKFVEAYGVNRCKRAQRDGELYKLAHRLYTQRSPEVHRQIAIAINNALMFTHGAFPNPKTLIPSKCTAHVVMLGDRGIAVVTSMDTEHATKVQVRCLRGCGIIHKGRASGYGYDRYRAALSGAVIDGHEIVDDCEVQLPYPTGQDFFYRTDFVPKGYFFSNIMTLPNGERGYKNCFKRAGLDYLQELGYTVITVM